MNKIIIGICLLLTVCLGACSNKGMTIEELKETTRWAKLDTAIDYISLEEGKAGPHDSIHYTVKGFTGDDIMMLAALGKGTMIPDSLIDRLVHNRLDNSRWGYLRFDIYKLMQKPELTITVYLSDSYDTTSLSRDLGKIRGLPGVKEVVFISKDSASRKYMNDSNEDWKKVLTENPLPASIDIYFDRKKMPSQHYEVIADSIRELITGVTDLQFPAPVDEKWKGNYLIMEYRRK